MDVHKVAISRLPPISSGISPQFSPRTGHPYEGLIGPQYTVGNRTVKYSLPPPGVLKPHQDTKAGALETWPAHATGNTNTSSAIALTKDKKLRMGEEEASGPGAMVPKPKFLDSLENFLKKELKALGVSQVMPSELRLQAHREVFEYLIEDFKTYKPLLSAIKNEYEMVLSAQREQVRQMEPLKQMLVTVSEHCDQKVMALRNEEKQEIVDLKNENKRLMKKIDGLHGEQGNLEAQVEKLQEELAAEYLRYRDQCDARKMLVADINDLRNQQEDMIMSKQSMDELEEGEKDDPITLKIALRKSREDEAGATKRLNDMIANYGDVIPRRDMESLQKQYAELEAKNEQLKFDFASLKNDHDTMIDVHRKVQQEKDDLESECENLRRSATPRPDWAKAADFVAGGTMRWKELSDSKTSQQLVDVLLQEIAGGGDSGADGAEYFDGRGTGEDVPAYLQCEGKVRNRRLGKRDCALLIKDIWREKAAADAEKGADSPSWLDEFLHDYLNRRFSLKEMVVEWGYNLQDASQRYSHDKQIGMFARILTREADEALYHKQLSMVMGLNTALAALDQEQGGLEQLSKEDLQNVLQQQLPSRSTEQIATLMKQAELQLDAKELETLAWKMLFNEESDGKTGPFLDEVRNQHNEDHEQYINEITAELGDASPVSMQDLKKALGMVDPEIDQPEMERYLCWAFNCTKDEMDSAQPVEAAYLSQRLLNGNLWRIGQKL